MFGEWRKWRNALVSDPEILGGELVFPGSRLSVRHVGEMLRRGEDEEALLQDYPHLSQRDLKFARKLVEAEPTRGGPKRREALAR